MAAQPPTWTLEELARDREIARDLFVQTRTEELPDEYEAFYRNAETGVRTLFEATDDLRNLEGEAFQAHPTIVDAARHVAAPTISEDDLETIVAVRLGRKTVNLKKKAGLSNDEAQALAEVVRHVVDDVRLPWLAQGRVPTDAEREAAIMATSTLIAVGSQLTKRKNNASKDQERAVADALESAGYTARPRNKVGTITVMTQLAPGEFTQEVKVGRDKCDVPVRLKDERFLPIECKVSNSGANSQKRLGHESTTKGVRWRQHFGDGQCIPAVVLAGVFEMVQLEAARNAGLTMFWQHDLSVLTEFARDAC